MYLDVEGDLLPCSSGECAELAERLLARDPVSPLGARLAQASDIVAVSLDDFDALRGTLGRWHADEGVLAADLRRLQEAVESALGVLPA